MKRRQAGFTLTELMVVVAIIGVLVTIALVYLRPRVRPIDVATRFGDLVREASRRAVALGPVRADVASALGKARTEIVAVPSGPTVTFTLYRLEEAPLGTATGTWVAIESYTTDTHVVVDSWAPDVVDHTSSKLATDWSAWAPPPPNLLPTPAPRTPLQCRPDGICDACTVFFQAAIASPTYEQFARISIMPLGGAVMTSPNWN
jgi:prepilin-type N-terminal cleavage/methylation domain-containing protein